MNRLVHVVAALATAWGAADPFMGTWQLDRAQSHFEGAEVPQRMTIVMTPDETGVRYHSETTLHNGRVATSDYSAAYGGTVVTVRGNVGILAPVALRRIAPDTVEANYFRGLKVVATSRRVVSAGGNAMSITTVSPTADGKPSTNLAVFTRATNSASSERH